MDRIGMRQHQMLNYHDADYEDDVVYDEVLCDLIVNALYFPLSFRMIDMYCYKVLEEEM